MEVKLLFDVCVRYPLTHAMTIVITTVSMNILREEG